MRCDIFATLVLLTALPPRKNIARKIIARSLGGRPLEGAIPFRYFGSAKIFCPTGAAHLDQRGVNGVGREGKEGNGFIVLLAVAIAAKAHKVFCYHSPAIAFGNNMAAFVSIPLAASGAAGVAGENRVTDGSGDAGFFGHGGSPTGVLAL